MPSQPQDHKKKSKNFTFTAEGKTYTLPDPRPHADKVPGGLTMDALENPDDESAQLRLGFALLRAAGPSDKAMSAFRSLPATEMFEVLGEWMGEFSGSSD